MGEQVIIGGGLGLLMALSTLLIRSLTTGQASAMKRYEQELVRQREYYEDRLSELAADRDFWRAKVLTGE